MLHEVVGCQVGQLNLIVKLSTIEADVILVQTPTGLVIPSKSFNGTPAELFINVSGLCEHTTSFCVAQQKETWRAVQQRGDWLPSLEKEYLLKLP